MKWSKNLQWTKYCDMSKIVVNHSSKCGGCSWCWLSTPFNDIFDVYVMELVHAHVMYSIALLISKHALLNNFPWIPINLHTLISVL